MFVYNKQKSQNVESTMLKQVEIDARKIKRVKTGRNIESKNTESIIIIRVENRKRDEVNSKSKSDKYKTRIKSTIKTSTITKSEKIKKLFRRRNPFTRLRDKIKKIKLEKIFLDSSPHDEPAE